MPKTIEEVRKQRRDAENRRREARGLLPRGKWGGHRDGAGAKADARATIAAEPKKTPDQALALSTAMMLAVTEASKRAAQERLGDTTFDPFKLPAFPPKAMPPEDSKLRMAMDESSGQWASGEWANALMSGIAGQGLLFLGYPYLAELAQRPEYRIVSETIADDATRKWIDFEVTGDETQKADQRRRAQQDPDGEAERMADPDERRKRVDAAGKMDKVKALKDDQKRLKVRDRVYELCRNDGFFGRSHLFFDFGADVESGNAELQAPVGDGRDEISRSKVQKGSFKNLRVIEPVWCYPTTYNAQNPLTADWYNPQVWFVMGTQVHVTRIPPFVSRPVPDMLKPAYAFGGLALSQIVKPAVDIWLVTRQSVGDLIHSYSVMVLMTDMQSILQPNDAANLLARVAMFNALRDNQGTFVVNKTTEDFKNVSATIAGLHELQAQAQEHVASLARIPLVKFTGLQPTGLNASSEGEINVYDDTISAYQERQIRPVLTRIVDFEQLSLFGEIDPEITFVFEPLRQLTEKEKGDKQKAEAERDQIYVDMGALAPAEVRKKIVDDPELPYANLDPDDVPDLLEEETRGLEPEGGRPQPQAGAGEGGEAGDEGIVPFGEDAEWEESEHPRAPDGKFGTGSGGGGKQTLHAPQFGLQHGTFTASSFAPSMPRRGNLGEEIDPAKLKKVGSQMGSNPGGVYEDADGKRFYVKQGKSKDHVRNEMIAAALYDLAGTPTLNYRPTLGGTHVATEIAKLDKDNASKLSANERREAARDFAVHAWLGNWDAVGLGGDNLGTIKGVPTALDLGGALEYRAQGAPKGKAFGNDVGEIDTLRDPKANKDAAGIFGAMTPAEMRESARYVAAIPDAKIRAAIEKFGGSTALANKLIARKQDVAERARTFGAEGDPMSADGTMVVPAGGKLPAKTLNGVKFAPWRPPADWVAVDGQAEIDEPVFEPGTKQPASGVVVREPDGRIWLVQPRGGFGGYEGTFPKGRVDEGLSLQANAIKEAWEESGLKVRITGFAGDHEGDVTTTRFYFAEREGGDPSSHGDETEGVVLAPTNKAPLFLNRKRDRAVLGLDEMPLPPILEEARKRDALGYLRDVWHVVREGDPDQWNASYDPDADQIVLEGKFEQESDVEKVRTMLHEAGHRGQYKIDVETFEDFKRRGLNTPRNFLTMANTTHVLDLEQRGKVDDLPGEVFAESYARAMLGMEQPDDVSRFWDERLARGAMDANFEESKHPRDNDGKFATSAGGGGSNAPQGGGAPVFKSKKEHAAHLLQKGTTTAEMLAALNWPSISMPAMAKTLGMKLEKVKEGGVTKYKGTPMTKEELAAAKAEAAAKKAAAPLPKAVQQVAPVKPAQIEQVVAAAPAPKFPDPTEQEVAKAKKSVPLQLQYVPGADVIQTPAGKGEAQKLIGAFNEKYAGKEMNSTPALIQKVNDFKILQVKMGAIAVVEKDKALEWAAQQKAEATKKAAAAKAAEEAIAKQQAEANKAVMKDLGINEKEAVGFVALAKMMGGKQADVVKSFQNYEAQAKEYGYPITGFQCALIKNYSDGGYQHINAALRSGTWTKAQHVYVKLVNKALAGMPRHTGVVNRGAGLTKEDQARYVVGNIVPEHAFTSTSTGGGFGGNTSFKITATGKRGASIKKLSNHSSENEVLFMARTFFHVTKVEGAPGGNMTVHMEEMEDDDYGR